MSLFLVALLAVASDPAPGQVWPGFRGRGDGCAEIVASGILKRLKVLDLRHGRITDQGARLLAECPDVRHLEHLDLELNYLSAEGVRLVRGIGISVCVDDQHAPREDMTMNDEDDYLSEGEFE